MQDYNITEKPYGAPRRQYGKTYSKGEKVCDVRLLHAEQTTQDWVSRHDYQQQKTQKKTFGLVKQPPKLKISEINFHLGSAAKSGEDNFRSNLLSKIPINSTIVDSLASPAQAMNRSFNEDFKNTINPLTASTSDLNSTQDSLNTTISDVPIQGPKTLYNNAIDAFSMVDKRKGFLLTNSINTGNSSTTVSANQPIVGVYCVRWRRSGEVLENETKLVINSVGKS